MSFTDWCLLIALTYGLAAISAALYRSALSVWAKLPVIAIVVWLFGTLLERLNLGSIL